MKEDGIWKRTKSGAEVGGLTFDGRKHVASREEGERFSPGFPLFSKAQKLARRKEV